jgi:hypothetical protein
MNLSKKGKRFCAVHSGNVDWQKAISTVGGGIVGNLILPGLGGIAVGALVGNVADKIDMENETMTKRVFVSFDFDKDKFLKDGVVGQSKNPDSPFSISDWSLKEEQEQAEWKEKARARIKVSDIVLVMVGTQTHKAPGVLAEVKIAREEEVKVVQVRGYPDKECPSVSGAGKYYKWTWENLKLLLG